MAIGKYIATPPALVEGQASHLLLTSDGKLQVAGSFVVDSEFPAAAALADNTATPTTTCVATFGMAYDGATWDFVRSGIVTAATGGTGYINIIPTGIYNTSAPTLTNGQTIALQLDVNGRLLVSTGSGSAAALADATANPTTTTSASDNMFFNGTTWDRGRSGVITPGTAVTGWQNVIGTVRYDTSKPTLTDGQYSVPRCNVNGAQDVNEVAMPGAENGTDGTFWTQVRALTTNTAGCPTTGGDIALVKSTVLRAAPTRFYGARILLDATATAATAFYVQIHDATSLPANTAVPLRSFKLSMPATQVDVFLDLAAVLGRFGVYCTTGCTICLSSTLGTLTLAGTAWMRVEDFSVG